MEMAKNILARVLEKRTKLLADYKPWPFSVILPIQYAPLLNLPYYIPHVNPEVTLRDRLLMVESVKEVLLNTDQSVHDIIVRSIS